MVVRGDNVVIFIHDNGVWKLHACGRSGTLNVSTETIDITTSGAGVWRSLLPTANSFTGSFDGVVYLNEAGKMTLPELRAKQIAHQQLLFRMQRTDEGGNVYTDEGFIYITTTSDTGTFNDVNTFNIDFVGSGALTQVFTLTPSAGGGSTVKDMRYEYTGSGGENGFVNGTIINKYILAANKDGIGNSKIITSGTPIAKEVKYTAATGEFEWALPFEPGEEAYIIYRDL